MDWEQAYPAFMRDPKTVGTDLDSYGADLEEIAALIQWGLAQPRDREWVRAMHPVARQFLTVLGELMEALED